MRFLFAENRVYGGRNSSMLSVTCFPYSCAVVSWVHITNHVIFHRSGRISCGRCRASWLDGFFGSAQQGEISTFVLRRA
jgi:hypothetical protein